MVAHARRTKYAESTIADLGARKTEDGVMYEFVHDNEFDKYYWLPLHPLMLYGEAMRDLQQLLNDRRKLSE